MSTCLIEKGHQFKPRARPPCPGARQEDARATGPSSRDSRTCGLWAGWVIFGLLLRDRAGCVLEVDRLPVEVRRRGPAPGRGLTRQRRPGTAAGFALVFAAVQFALTLWGYDLPASVDWVPMLVMALVVGVFESVFFRGFIQTRLEARFGTVAGVGGAAVLYGAYHVGFGMTGSELLFLTGLGVVYAVAFAVARNLIVLWPLLTPLGSFYANLEAGDIELPWASIAGFADVLALMILSWWLTRRYQRKHHQSDDRHLEAAAKT
jgi:membrane protease YdiL (CAAX protease family)